MRDSLSPQLTWNPLTLAPPAPERVAFPTTPPFAAWEVPGPIEAGGTGRLHDVFTASARRAPLAPAVSSGGTTTTYAHLDGRSDRLARRLNARGVGPGVAVGISMERGADAYAALLAVLKAGAAYVGLDPSSPPERVAAIAEDCGMTLVLHDGSGRLPEGVEPVRLVDLEAGPAPSPLENLTRQATPEDICYIIYTSGSTGRPKGVAIEHRSAAHFVEAGSAVYGITASDRVWQGFSWAFDASVEEIWLAFAAGACLVSGTRAQVTSGPSLADHLAAGGVTVFSCVPTTLSLFERDLPALRLLIVGGESCPPELVTRWARPGRRMLNTYGPTEAAVVATWSELEPGQPVTIGHPLPGYRVMLLDESLDETEPGAVGQIYIGGPCLARGYVNLPGLTAERFIANPHAALMPDAPRLYATGDLASRGPDGALAFRGRQDGQVKLRGFRIELGELESALMTQPGVRAAAAAVQERAPGQRDLVAYVVMGPDATLDRGAVLASLRAALPTYMLPAFIETLDALPTSMSGKLDRGRLPAPRPASAVGGTDLVAPHGHTEEAVAAVCARVLGHAQVSVVDDFFLHLGGHSLAAAQVVCALRKEAGVRLDVPDVYSHPTVRGMATLIESRTEPSPDEDAMPAQATLPVSCLRHTLGGAAQAVLLYPLFLLHMLPLLLSFVALETVQAPPLVLVGVIAALGLAGGPLTMGLAVAAKWLLIGRYSEGSHPLWGSYYLRWWFVHKVESLVPLASFAGSPLAVTYARLMGARIGRGVYLALSEPVAWDLLEIGDGASVGDALSCYAVTGGRLHLGRVRIGRDAYVGERAFVSPGATVEDGAVLDMLGMLEAGATIPEGERWGGSPARRLDEADPDLEALRAQPASKEPARLPFALAGLGITALPGLAALAELPLVLWSYNTFGALGLVLVIPPAALTFVLVFALVVVVVKRLLPPVRPGIAPLASRTYLHRWVVDRLMQSALETMPTMFGTLYTAPWLRLLGASIGRRSEVSTVSHFAPDLISLGAGSFLADDVHVHTIKVCAGYALSLPASLGAGSFIGNSASVTMGTVLPDDCLVGVLSASPRRAAPNTSWLGSPPIHLPRRQIVDGYDETQTLTPPRRLVALRLAIEACRIVVPPVLIGLAGVAVFESLVALTTQFGLLIAILLAPVVQAGWGGLMALVVAGLKWSIVRRYRPRVDPLWSHFVWRSELVTGLYEAVAVPLLLETLLGTPFAAWYLRLLGTRIGSRTYLESANITEFDLVSLGDETALGRECTIQTHLFEDRVFKMDTLTIGAGGGVGAHTVVLYGTEMAAAAELGPLSLMMKGESFGPDTHWTGIPARQQPS